MKAVLTQFWRICLLRAGPETIPGNGALLALVLFGNLCLSLTLNVAYGPQPALAYLTQIVVAVATQASLIWLALMLRERAHRFDIVLTTVLGCDLIITALIGTCLLLGTAISGEAFLQSSASTALVVLFQLWFTVIFGFILHRSLELSLLLGILLAFVISFASVLTGISAIA